MLGLRLQELSTELRLSPLGRAGKSTVVPQPLATEIITAWFLRLWFLGQINPDYLSLAFKASQVEDSSYSFFQIIRILFERGIHEPSDRHRKLAKSFIDKIVFAGPPIESTAWWEETLIKDSSAYGVYADGIKRLIDLAGKCSTTDIKLLFPQVTSEQFTAVQTLVTSDKNAIRAKLYICTSQVPTPVPNLNHTVKHDPALIFHTSLLPAESHTREYKATFRWDSRHQQKNVEQQFACLKTICAFLNADGGTLIIGVDDSRHVIGLTGDFSILKSDDPQDALLQIFYEALRQQIDPIPHGLVQVQFQPYGDHLILTVNVAKSQHTHLLKQKGETPAHFVRDGNRTIRLKS